MIAAIFGFLWIRDVTAEYRTEPAPRATEPEPAPPVPAHLPDEGELVRFPRAKFLEAATLGLGGVIGGIVTLPVLGFTVLPPFIKQGHPEIDVGAIDDFPENKFVITTFLRNPSEGEISRRTAYIRNNGFIDNLPSFTVLSNRCAHLGCPVQPNGPMFDKQKIDEKTKTGDVTLIPVLPAGGFGCPCHGGQYDQEGNRTAGPPVRALDRYEFYIRNGRMAVGRTYSVSHVDGAGASAKIHKYKETGPGEHVDGPEQWFYPLQPPT